MSSPLAPRRTPGVERFRLGGYAATGATPQSKTIQIPHYGSWLLDVYAWAGNGNNGIYVPAVVAWWKFDAAGDQAKTVAFTGLIGTPAPTAELGAPGTVNPVNSLTVSAPSASGVVTIGVGWNDGASKTPYVDVKGMLMRFALEFA